jgi:PIN domain nuclease of toxin-antitoxin system
VTVLDAQAVIAHMRNEPAADDVEAILRAPQHIAFVSAITIAEIFDVLVRTGRARVEAAAAAVDLLLASGVEVVPVDQEVASLAGILRARHWRRETRPVSLADCTVLATAMIRQEPLATADGSLIGVARAEGHPVVVLPDSQGRRAD